GSPPGPAPGAARGPGGARTPAPGRPGGGGAAPPPPPPRPPGAPPPPPAEGAVAVLWLPEHAPTDTGSYPMLP
ncbi:two-component sensor histidine kinase, partial [Streptomyces hirsutus]